MRSEGRKRGNAEKENKKGINIQERLNMQRGLFILLGRERERERAEKIMAASRIIKQSLEQGCNRPLIIAVLEEKARN